MSNLETPKELSLDCRRMCQNKYVSDGMYYPKFLYKQFFQNSKVDNVRAINKIIININ